MKGEIKELFFLTEQRKEKTQMQVIKSFISLVVRRVIDVVFSGLALAFLWPLFLIIVFQIKKDSPGPAFYRGKRVGKHGEIFEILKFRTMYESPESYHGNKVTATGDKRITTIGKTLRDTKLNELPQLWNVFVGEMSLVGPRPEDPEIAKKWSDSDKREIFSVKPGLTSPASIVYRNEEKMLQSEDIMNQYFWDILPTKLRLDQLYIRKRNILSDLDVIFWTLIALVPRLKDFEIQEHLLFQGPLNLLFRRYVRWFILDFFVALISVSMAGVLRRLNSPLDIGVIPSIGIALSVALLFSLVNTMLGINRIEWRLASAGESLDIAISIGIVTFILFFINMALPAALKLPQIVLVTSSMFAFIGFIFVRYRGRIITGLATRWTKLRGTKAGGLGEPVIIIGAGEAANFGIWLLKNSPFAQAFNIVGFLDDDPVKIGTRIDGVQVVGSTANIGNFISKYDVGLVLFAINNISLTDSEKILEQCRQANTRIIMLVDILESLRIYFPSGTVDEDSIKENLIDKNSKDRLTGVLNQGSFMRTLRIELTRAKRYNRQCSLIRLRINYSWPPGVSHKQVIVSQILQKVAEAAAKQIRIIDTIGRYEENDFVILMPETKKASAEIVVERIIQNLTAQPIQTDRGPIPINIPYGCVTQNADYSFDPESFIAAVTADMVNLEVRQLAL